MLIMLALVVSLKAYLAAYSIKFISSSLSIQCPIITDGEGLNMAG